MEQSTPETITRKEFDKRLDAFNEHQEEELQQAEEEQMRVEQLLTRYEQTLDEIEVKLHSTDEVPSQSRLLRKRLQELATRTAEMAASL